ncbi:MAG TPA: hypothetical protein VK021_11840 [Flavobacteriaceae bacterium]|nr:hypothetical protein [Flavobacteriaceae bacterium]
MKVFMLSLVMLIGVSFAGNAEQQKNTIAFSDPCDQCNYMLQHILEGLKEEHDMKGVEANNIAMPIYYTCRRECYSQ